MGLSDNLPVGSTFNLPIPRRPGLSDLLADTKLDDTAWPPTAGMLCAAEVNNGGSTLAGLAKTVPSLKFSASIPNLGGPLAINTLVAVGTNPSIAMLTPIRTPGGASAGDFTISWPTTMLPPVTFVEGTATGAFISVTGGSGGVRVVTTNGSGAGVDVPFVVTVT